MIIDSHVHIFPETLISNRKNLLDKDLTFRTLFSNNNAKMVTAEDLISMAETQGMLLRIDENRWTLLE